MLTLRLQMTRPEFVARLRDFPGTFTGRVPDTSRIVEPVVMAGALAMLARLYAHAMRLARGGTGDDGIRLEPLKAPTLALRQKVTTKSALSRLVSEVRKQGPARRKLFLTQLKRARTVFSDARQRRVTLSILRRIKPTITEKRYNELFKLLHSKPPKLSRRPKNASPRQNALYDRLDTIKLKKYQKKLNVFAFAAAGALILYDSGRMVGAFSPAYQGGDQKREVKPGGFTLGNNVDYFVFHQSDEPRKLGKDGKPRLPRRNLIPDVIPDSWIRDARDAMTAVMGSADILRRYFEGAA